jgi:hypothetical protein
VSQTDDDDDTTTTQRGHGRPNAFWAKVREEQNLAREGDQFGGAYRGVKPAPHGGTATVKPEDTLGAQDLCWCGQPAGHSWPGKTTGARHPQMGDAMSSTATGLDRRDLRAYDKTLQDFVLHCVNTLGIRYRANQNSILLFPPDGTSPMSVFARNSQKQLRPLEKWFTEHVAPSFETEEKVDEEDLKKLAAAKNHPVEHPKVETKKAEPAKPEEYLPPREDEDTPRGKSYEIPTALPGNTEWVPWVRGDGTTDDIIETNGEQMRCRLCAGTDHEYLQAASRSIGGHKRIYHTDTSDMHSPEAREKATQTKRQRVMANSQVIQAIDLLMNASGYNPNPDTERIEELETQLAAAIQRAEELEAKLALIREATGL